MKKSTSKVKSKPAYLGFDALPTHIQGYPTKLLKLGWKPTKSIDNILLGVTSFGQNN
jgi:hypothetical protein